MQASVKAFGACGVLRVHIMCVRACHHTIGFFPERKMILLEIEVHSDQAGIPPSCSDEFPEAAAFLCVPWRDGQARLSGTTVGRSEH